MTEDTRQQFVKEGMAVARWICSKHKEQIAFTWLTFDDFVQEMTFALLRLLDRYDENSKASFMTYARNRLEGEYYDILRRYIYRREICEEGIREVLRPRLLSIDTKFEDEMEAPDLDCNLQGRKPEMSVEERFELEDELHHVMRKVTREQCILKEERKEKYYTTMQLGYQGYTNKQIATQVGVSPTYVSGWLQATRRALHEHFKGSKYQSWFGARGEE